MSAEETLGPGAIQMWRDLTAVAVDKQWIPIAVIGSKRFGEEYHAGVARARDCPPRVLLEILRQIVAELERAEACGGRPAEPGVH